MISTTILTLLSFFEVDSLVKNHVNYGVFPHFWWAKFEKTAKNGLCLAKSLSCVRISKLLAHNNYFRKVYLFALRLSYITHFFDKNWDFGGLLKIGCCYPKRPILGTFWHLVHKNDLKPLKMAYLWQNH